MSAIRRTLGINQQNHPVNARNNNQNKILKVAIGALLVLGAVLAVAAQPAAPLVIGAVLAFAAQPAALLFLGSGVILFIASLCCCNTSTTRRTNNIWVAPRPNYFSRPFIPAPRTNHFWNTPIFRQGRTNAPLHENKHQVGGGNRRGFAHSIPLRTVPRANTRYEYNKEPENLFSTPRKHGVGRRA